MSTPNCNRDKSFTLSRTEPPRVTVSLSSTRTTSWPVSQHKVNRIKHLSSKRKELELRLN